MYVEKLTIKNFRCFANTEVHLNYPEQEPHHGLKLPERFKNVTLFIGTNGSGKTSVFKALCLSVLGRVISNSGLLVEFFIRRPAYDSEEARDLTENRALPDAEITAKLRLHEADVDLEWSSEPFTNLVGYTRIHRQGDFEVVTVGKDSPNAWKRIYENSSPAFFVVAYGANRRAANPEGYTERNRSLRYQRIASIFEEYAGLIPFTVGYLELLQTNLLPEAIRILNRLLPEQVSLTEILSPDRTPRFNAFGVLTPFSALSDGYRGFIAWIWDLLVQMARSLPPNSSGKQLRQLRGVVMVDEIDLFLHPHWQRLLIEELAKEFENLQFLFSTHSPLVVGMLESENIRIINRQGDASTIEQYEEEVEGKTPNEILTSAYFNLSSTRSPYSGTLSQQAEREMMNEEVATNGVSTNVLNVGQKRRLTKMLQQSRAYERAIKSVEEESTEDK